MIELKLNETIDVILKFGKKRYDYDYVIDQLIKSFQSSA